MKKSDVERWFNLSPGERKTPLSRRQLLKIARDVSALALLGSTSGFTVDRRSATTIGQRFQIDPFVFGVASGDPAADGVVLWTRLGQEALAQSGTQGSPVPVRWEIATDQQFRSLVGAGSATARPELGHSVHVVAEGLRPGATYWYRFMSGDAESVIGRTRTAPAEGDGPESVRFSFVSCQNYEHGYFTAFRHLAAEIPDVILHLGDYIYEKRFTSSEAVREHEAGEVFTLDEYRARYSTYRRDADLQAAHAIAPWVVTFDDHEVDNNWTDRVAEDDQTVAELMLRRAAAFQAYYEFMPLRPLSMPKGPDIQMYRTIEFGDLVKFFVLDTRQFRSDQACGDRTKVRCAEAFDPSRTMMGSAQERWLFDGIRSSSARWNVLANQVMVSALARTVGEDLTYSMDRWDGYVEAQKRFTKFLSTVPETNPVIVTGDIHSNWVADVKEDFDDPSSRTVATEFVGTSMTSGGDGRVGARALPGIQRLNPHIHHYDGKRGYVRVEVGDDVLKADYRRVEFVSRPGAPVETSVSYVVETGEPGIKEA